MIVLVEKKSDIEKLHEEYRGSDLEFEHARMLLEISKVASRGLSGNVNFVAKQTARHHIIKGLLQQ